MSDLLWISVGVRDVIPSVALSLMSTAWTRQWIWFGGNDLIVPVNIFCLHNILLNTQIIILTFSTCCSSHMNNSTPTGHISIPNGHKYPRSSNAAKEDCWWIWFKQGWPSVWWRYWKLSQNLTKNAGIERKDLRLFTFLCRCTEFKLLTAHPPEEILLKALDQNSDGQVDAGELMQVRSMLTWNVIN